MSREQGSKNIMRQGKEIVCAMLDAVSFAPKPEDIHCPVCGYYCLGRGGMGCIDKPFIVEHEQSMEGREDG